MKLLLTSSGISNQSINDALVVLLGKPIADSTALFVPTGMHPFPGGGRVIEAMRDGAASPLLELGWKSLALLELTALPSVRRENWVPALHEADALLVWGGNVMYLRYWMQQSGLADLLPTLDDLVYVGVSAGSIVMTPFNCDAESNQRFAPDGSDMTRGSEFGLGFVDFTMWVHVDNPNPIFEDHTMANVEKWAREIPVPTYGIDDQTAIKVTDGIVDVVSEGHWKLFTPGG